MPNETIEQTLPLEGHASKATEAPVERRDVAAASARPPASRSAPSGALSETMAVIAMMERMAKNKDVDVAKMAQVRELGMAIIADQRRDAFNEAMAAAQAEMNPVIADAKNGETQSKYASHAALDRALRPIYTGHGFQLTYDTEPNPAPEMMTFICDASAGGHTRRYRIELPVDGKGPKGGNVMSRTHAASSGVTYAMRILLKMVFNIAIDRDDDGNAAGRTVIDNVDPKIPKVTEDQIVALHEKCEAVGCPRQRFLSHIRISRFEDIPAADFAAHIQLLGTFIRK
jgi:pyruvate/2-oxoglutarate dehydrogenase complex dihydrolipoamide acyltransferase (E2) component